MSECVAVCMCLGVWGACGGVQGRVENDDDDECVHVCVRVCCVC